MDEKKNKDNETNTENTTPEKNETNKETIKITRKRKKQKQTDNNNNKITIKVKRKEVLSTVAEQQTMNQNNKNEKEERKENKEHKEMTIVARYILWKKKHNAEIELYGASEKDTNKVYKLLAEFLYKESPALGRLCDKKDFPMEDAETCAILLDMMSNDFDVSEFMDYLEAHYEQLPDVFAYGIVGRVKDQLQEVRQMRDEMSTLETREVDNLFDFLAENGEKNVYIYFQDGESFPFVVPHEDELDDVYAIQLMHIVSSFIFSGSVMVIEEKYKNRVEVRAIENDRGVWKPLHVEQIRKYFGKDIEERNKGAMHSYIYEERTDYPQVESFDLTKYKT